MSDLYLRPSSRRLWDLHSLSPEGAHTHRYSPGGPDCTHVCHARPEKHLQGHRRQKPVHSRGPYTRGSPPRGHLLELGEKKKIRLEAHLGTFVHMRGYLQSPLVEHVCTRALKPMAAGLLQTRTPGTSSIRGNSHTPLTLSLTPAAPIFSALCCIYHAYNYISFLFSL